MDGAHKKYCAENKVNGATTKASLYPARAAARQEQQQQQRNSRL